MALCFSCFKEYDDEYNVCPNCGQVEITEPVLPIDLVPGTKLAGRYIIGTRIGYGGFSIVYRAYDTTLSNIVAIKEFYSSSLAFRVSGESEISVIKKQIDEFEYRKERFLAEARRMAKFSSHKNIVNVYDHFTENGTSYIVMEMLKGYSLAEYLETQDKEKIDVETTVQIANEIGTALDSLHKEGIIHRDVAPDNIWMSENGVIKLMDLGAAKLADEDPDVEDKIQKIGYTPPEQTADPNNVSPKNDVYALGATLYKCLTGIVPQVSDDRKEDDKVKPPHVLEPSISENLSNTVMKAMAIEKHMRFKDMPELLKAVNGERKVVSLEKEKIYKRRKRISGVLIAVLLLAVIAGALLYKYESDKKEVSLDPATITVWYSADEGDAKIKAMEAIAADFESAYEGVYVELLNIPSQEYEMRIKEAAEQDSLPNLFESTDLSGGILSKAISLDSVVATEQFADTVISTTYSQRYVDKKQMPLAFNVPVAVVITKGTVTSPYTDTTFSSLSDLGTSVSYDESVISILKNNFGDGITSYQPSSAFIATTPVLVTSSSNIDVVRNKLANSGLIINENYIVSFLEASKCEMTYEWSIGSASNEEVRASERLLSWMLGNVYQDYLTMSYNPINALPVNERSFNNKCDAAEYYDSLKGLKGSLVF